MPDLRKIAQPKNWKELVRHPLCGEYRDIDGVAWENFKADLEEFGIVDRRIVIEDREVIEGWQLYRACVELDLKPNFAGVPNGMSLPDFIRIKNDNRRHEPEECIRLRRERVAEARRAGKSLRAIAEEEDVGESTVRRDLETSTAPGGGAVEPEGGKVTGQDGKKRPAKATPILCDRCNRVGSVKDCPMCAEARKGTAKKRRKTIKSAGKVVDAKGKDVPAHCRKPLADPWMQQAIDFLAITEEKIRKERLADTFNKRKELYPFVNAKDFIDGVAMAMNTLDELIEHLKENRPAFLCPHCEGERCSKCKMSGLVPRGKK